MTYSIQKFTTTAIATALLLASATSGTFAAWVDVSGNGAESNNTVKVKTNCAVGVSQLNQTVVVNEVNSSASTGGNHAKGNTGTDVSVSTGDANSAVTVTVAGGSNEATAPSCCECNATADVQVVENGWKSRNKVVLKNNKETLVQQLSSTEVQNLVKSKVSTGKNKTNWNTGKHSSVEVLTGSSSSMVDVAVIGGSNILH